MRRDEAVPIQSRCEEIVGNEEGRCTRKPVVRVVMAGAGSWHFYCRQHIRSITNNSTRDMTVIELNTGEGWTA